MHSNITTPGYSISQQETVRGKSRTVNHVNNVQQGSRRNPKEWYSRRSNHNLHIVGRRTLKITSSGQILQTVHHDWLQKRQTNQQTLRSDYRYVKIIDNSSILNHQDVAEINKPYPYAQASYRTKYVYVCTSRLTRKSRIRSKNPINAYTYAQAA